MRYRAEYRGRRTMFYPHWGLIPLDTDTIYTEDSSFSYAVQHLDWESHDSSYISFFSDRMHDDNWVLDRHGRFLTNGTFLEIGATMNVKIANTSIARRPVRRRRIRSSFSHSSML